MLTLFKHIKAIAFVAGLGIVCGSPLPAPAMEVAQYKKLLEETVKEAVSGTIGDPDATVARLEQALKLAIDGAKAFIAKEPSHQKVFGALIGGLDKLKRMPADDVEAEWGEDGNQFAATASISRSTTSSRPRRASST
jgi:hypothetical protein